MGNTLSCTQFIRYLSDYIDGELNEELTAAAEEHLTNCPSCRVVLDTTQKMLSLYHTHGQMIISRQRRERLFARLKTAVLQSKEPATTENNQTR